MPLIARLRSVGGKLRDAQVGEVLDEEVVLAHVRHPGSVWRERGEHEGRGLGLTAELLQPLRAAVEQPVIAARVLPPDALRIGEQEQLLRVGRPGVAFDPQGLRPPGRDQVRGRHPNLAPARRRIVMHDVLCAFCVRGGFQDRVAGTSSSQHAGPHFLASNSPRSKSRASVSGDDGASSSAHRRGAA